MWLSEFLYENKVFSSKNQAKKNCFSRNVEIDGKTVWKDKKLNHTNYKIIFKIGTEFKIKLMSK